MLRRWVMKIRWLVTMVFVLLLAAVPISASGAQPRRAEHDNDLAAGHLPRCPQHLFQRIRCVRKIDQRRKVLPEVDPLHPSRHPMHA